MKFTYASGDRPLEGYTIKRGIGRGGFGEVYYATSDGGKEVALKLVQRNLDVELRGVSQCLNLKHPNLVQLYDVKQTEPGDCWIVMEYLGGECLADVVASHPEGLPAEEAVRWMEGIGQAVSYLHSRGIVHRDLKPGNIFIEDGTVKIGDYGLSKFISASRRSGQTGSVGTVHYMAPEVANGRYGKEIDMYALGIVLYEMFTGQVPFTGESVAEILMKHLTAQPDLEPLPWQYRQVVARALAKNPEDRYDSISELLADLNGQAPQTAATEPVAAVRGPERHRETREARRAIRSVDSALDRLRTPPETLRGAISQLCTLFARLLKLCLTMAMLALAVALLPLRFFVWLLNGILNTAPKLSGNLFTSHKPQPHRVELRHRGSLVTRFLVGLLRFAMVVFVSVGVAMVLCGLGLSMDIRDDYAIPFGMGAGFITFGVIASRWFRGVSEKHAGLRMTGLGLAAIACLGIGVGLAVVGLMSPLFGRGEEEVAIMFGFGAGFLISAIAAANLFLPFEGWLYGLRVIVFRTALALFLALGVGLSTGAFLVLFTGSRMTEEALLLGAGAGFVSFGISTYKMFTERSLANRPGRVGP